MQIDANEQLLHKTEESEAMSLPEHKRILCRYQRVGSCFHRESTPWETVAIAPVPQVDHAWELRVSDTIRKNEKTAQRQQRL